MNKIKLNSMYGKFGVNNKIAKIEGGYKILTYDERIKSIPVNKVYDIELKSGLWVEGFLYSIDTIEQIIGLVDCNISGTLKEDDYVGKMFIPFELINAIYKGEKEEDRVL